MCLRNIHFRAGRLRRLGVATLLFLAASSLSAKEKAAVDYGTGLIVNIPLPEAEVTQVVKEAAGNGIIRGTKEYNKDEYIKGAEAESSSNVFPAWTDGGQVFYKVRKQALDPRNFKDSGDLGTLAVRYIIQPRGEKNTVLRIDAIFVEEFRRKAHPSNGSVESSEYQNIQEHLDSIELMKKQAAEAEIERQALLAKKKFDSAQGSSASTPGTANKPAVPNSSDAPSSEAMAYPPPTATVADLAKDDSPAAVGPRPGESLQEYAADLRRQVERRVKFPGAPLKSAPFHSAGTMKTLSSGTEVLIVISTPYWLGVETRDGEHGWVTREELEELK